mgnify:CR=1 FL=1
MPEFFSVDSSGTVKTLKDGGSGNITAMTSKGQGASLRVDTSIYSNKIDAKCGSAHGKTFSSVPENNLCQQSSAIYGQLKGGKYYWTCSGENGGSSASCQATITTNGTNTTPTPLPVTYYIKVSPTSLRLKVGQSQNITYIFSPSGPNDNLTRSVSSEGFVKIQEINVKCSEKEGTKCMEILGTKHLKVTALKAGKVTIKFTRSINGKSSVTEVPVVIEDKKDEVINGVCGDIKYSELSKNSSIDRNIKLCKSGKLGEAFTVDEKGNGDLTYVWDCLGLNGGSNIQCNVANTNKKINGVCGTVKYSDLTLTTDKDKPGILCKSGKPVNFERTSANVTNRVPLYYSWDCLGLNGGEGMGCGVNPPAINGVCGTLKASQVTPNIDKEKPELLCKSGKVGNFTKTTDAYWWDCTGINGGSSTGCGFDNPGDNNVINGACGSVKYNEISLNVEKENPRLLCKSGKVSEFTMVQSNKCACPPNTSNCKCPQNSGDFYAWKCLGSNGGKNVKCSIKNNNTNENGVCGDTTKIVTNTCVSGSPIDLPDTINEYIWQCKGSKTTQRCVKVKGSDDYLCPKNQFNHWGKCENDLEIGWGCDRDGVCISGKCDLVTSRCVSQESKIPATNIRISPLGLNLKVGRSQELIYILFPNNSTDTVKWSTSGNGAVRIQKTIQKCASGTKCISDSPGVNRLYVTALKAGTVKITLTTSSGKKATATVVINK